MRRLVIEIDPLEHREIRQMAAAAGLTIKDLVRQRLGLMDEAAAVVPVKEEKLCKNPFCRIEGPHAAHEKRNRT